MGQSIKLSNPIAIALRAGLAACCLWCAPAVWGQKPGIPPTEVAQALERLKIPADALSVVILDPQRPEPALWLHRPEVSVNPASLMKLVTTTAALDLLGPAFTWNTPVYVDGPIKDGVLQGNVYLRGQGDPRLVVERLWLLLRRLQAQGVARIQGDIVLDRSAFALAPRDPASFDGEPLRPYNAAPDALLINFKSIVLGFVPDAAAKLAHVQLDPPMAGVSHTTIKVHPAIPARDMVVLVSKEFAHQDGVGRSVVERSKLNFATKTVEATAQVVCVAGVAVVGAPAITHIQRSGRLTPLLVGVCAATAVHTLWSHAAYIVEHLIVGH